MSDPRWTVEPWDEGDVLALGGLPTTEFAVEIWDGDEPTTILYSIGDATYDALVALVRGAGEVEQLREALDVTSAKCRESIDRVAEERDEVQTRLEAAETVIRQARHELAFAIAGLEDKANSIAGYEVKALRFALRLLPAPDEAIARARADQPVPDMAREFHEPWDEPVPDTGAET